MEDLFLKIIRGEVPSHKVYEDEFTFAFLDINPHNKGHVLVVPKTHFRNVFDIDEETFCALMKTVKKLAPAVQKATGAEGINIGMNNEKAAGQIVFHAHVHIIPRFEDDQIYQPAKYMKYAEGEMEKIAESIRNNLI
jgi:histidine triad (HIT) family protein